MGKILKIIAGISIIIAAGIISSTLLSGKAEINIQHHMNLPKELTNHHEVTVTKHWYGATTVSVRLAEQIKGTDTIRNITDAISGLGVGDTVVFHIAGFGGHVDSLFEIVNLLKKSHAHVIMIVEGPAYSAYAYLAVSGDELIMLPNTFLMFHTSSMYGLDCSTQTGTDRTVSNVEHCQEMYKAHFELFNAFIDQLPLLTDNEKEFIKTGHDIYLFPKEIQNRQNGKPPVESVPDVVNIPLSDNISINLE